MHGQQIQDRAFRRLTIGMLGLDAKTRRGTAADIQAMTELTNLDLLPPDLTMPIQQLDTGQPVFVVGISDPDGPDWIL